MARSALRRSAEMSAPIIILAPIGSKGSLLAAALGRHPDLFAAPHLNLLAFKTAAQLVGFARSPRDVHLHGLLRMLSWVLLGEQSIEGVSAARRWLARRANDSALSVHGELRAAVLPQRLVEYSPLYVYHPDVLARVVGAFPAAAYIHLVRHPSSTALEIGRAAMQTMAAIMDDRASHSTNQPSMDIVELTDTVVDWDVDPPVFDPQFLWHRSHSWIATALERLPRRQTIRVRSEDLVADPDIELERVCHHFGLRYTRATLDGMRRPQDDAFAKPGPYQTAVGVDWDFIEQPRFADVDAATASSDPLYEALPWRGDGSGYRPETIALAENLGYGVMGLARGRTDAEWPPIIEPFGEIEP